MTISNQSSARPQPLKPVPDPEEVSFGTWLRRQRELREISLREIADVTKISIRYLEALERDRFDILPAPVFARGFLREYARYVGLNPDEVVNSYISVQHPIETEEEAARIHHQRNLGNRRWKTAWLLGALVMVLLVAGSVIYFFQRDQQPPGGLDRSSSSSTPEPSVPDSEAREVPLLEVSPVSTSPHLITMRILDDCWIETVVDDRTRKSELHSVGDLVQIEARERVVLTVDNPSAIELEVDGERQETRFDSSTVPSTMEIDLQVAAVEEDPPQ